jgi:hypothetical protein
VLQPAQITNFNCRQQMLPPKYSMKFNYKTYRPKRLIQDIWPVNNNYFKSRDVHVTPLTKIGDATKLHQEQKAGKIPALAQKLKPIQLATKILRFRRPATTKINVRMPDEPSLAPAHKREAAFLPALTGYARRVSGILRTRRAALPLAMSALLVLTGGTGGAFQLISESHGSQPADTQKTNNSNQGDQHAAENSGTKKDSSTEPDKDKPTPPTPDPSPQNQGTGTAGPTGTNNNSYRKNHTIYPKAAVPDTSQAPQVPAAPTPTTSTPPPAPAAPQPAPDTSTPPSENDPTGSTPTTDPTTTVPGTNDTSGTPTTETAPSTRTMIYPGSTSTSP